MIVVFYALTLNLLIFLDCYAISVCQKLTSLTEVNSVCKSFTMNWLGINKKHCYTRVVWYSTGLDCPSKFRSHCTEKISSRHKKLASDSISEIAFDLRHLNAHWHGWFAHFQNLRKSLLYRHRVTAYIITTTGNPKLLWKDMAEFPIVPMRKKWSNVKSVFAFT